MINNILISFSENSQLFNLIGVIALLMSSNTILKLAACSINGDFDWRKLLKGLYKYVLILVSVLFIICAGLMMPNIAIISVGGETLTILQALSASAMAIIVVYAGKCYENLKNVFGLSLSDEKVTEISDLLERDKG